MATRSGVRQYQKRCCVSCRFKQLLQQFQNQTAAVGVLNGNFPSFKSEGTSLFVHAHPFARLPSTFFDTLIDVWIF